MSARIRRLAILGFHQIGEPSAGNWKTWFYISEAIFVDQLRYLRDQGWQILDVHAFLTGLAAPESLPERSALLTFDDGHRSIRDVALPCLRQFGFPGVLFVPTQYIAGHNTFDKGMEPIEPICDWDDLRELERGGVSIQSHAVSHRRFSELDSAEREEELLVSKRVLESTLEKAVDVLAFPYGDNGGNDQAIADALTRTGYRAACLYGGGALSLPVVEPFRLARVAMGPDTKLDAVLAKG